MPAWPEPLQAAVRSLPETPHLQVALSGGMDSTLLLHLAVEVMGPERVSAIHINHQLQPNSDQTESFCRALCGQLGVNLMVRRLQLSAGGQLPQGLEEAARKARYGVFRELLAPGELLLMAHHGDDQAETVLFRLLRGTGPRGLAGIPRERPLGQGALMRPLLDFSRRQLHQWAVEQELEWVEDPSNEDQGFDRNFLRHRVLPLLESRWPSLNRRLAHTASACAEADRLADRLAQIQFPEVVTDDGSLALASLAAYTMVEQKNLLRWWLAEQGVAMPSLASWEQVIRQFTGAAEDREPELKVPGGVLRRYQGRLYRIPEPSAAPPEDCLLTPGDPCRWHDWVLSLEGPNSCAPGLPPSLKVTARKGGERFRSHPGGPSRPLKKWLQEQALPPWIRSRIPLVLLEQEGADRLVAIGDLWQAPEFSGAAPDSGWRIRVRKESD